VAGSFDSSAASALDGQSTKELKHGKSDYVFPASIIDILLNVPVEN
jgi:hypothetical protein